jgi:hypothetical protein
LTCGFQATSQESCTDGKKAPDRSPKTSPSRSGRSSSRPYRRAPRTAINPPRRSSLICGSPGGSIKRGPTPHQPQRSGVCANGVTCGDRCPSPGR